MVKYRGRFDDVFLGANFMKLINIGFGNLVAADRVLAVVSPDAAPVKRAIADAKAAGRLIDASCGRATAAVIFCDNGMIVLSAATPQTLQGRIDREDLE